MTIQEIKQDYARKHGYVSFNHLYTMCDIETFNNHLNEIIRISQLAFITSVSRDNIATNHLMSYDGLAECLTNTYNLIK